MHLAWQELGLLKIYKLTLERCCSPGGDAAFSATLVQLDSVSLGRGPLIVASASKEPTFGTTVSLGQ